MLSDFPDPAEEFRELVVVHPTGLSSQCAQATEKARAAGRSADAVRASMVTRGGTNVITRSSDSPAPQHAGAGRVRPSELIRGRLRIFAKGSWRSSLGGSF